MFIAWQLSRAGSSTLLDVSSTSCNSSVILYYFQYQILVSDCCNAILFPYSRKIFLMLHNFYICLFPTTMFGNFPVFLPPKAANAIHWKSNLSELLVPYYCQYQHVDIISIGWCFLTYVIEVLDIFSAVCKLQKLMFCMIMTLLSVY